MSNSALSSDGARLLWSHLAADYVNYLLTVVNRSVYYHLLFFMVRLKKIKKFTCVAVTHLVKDTFEQI